MPAFRISFDEIQRRAGLVTIYADDIDAAEQAFIDGMDRGIGAENAFDYVNLNRWEPHDYVIDYIEPDNE